MKRRPDGSGSLYKRRVDDRWFASAVTREPGGARRRRTVSATLFCTALRRISELNLPRADARIAVVGGIGPGFDRRRKPVRL